MPGPVLRRRLRGLTHQLAPRAVADASGPPQLVRVCAHRGCSISHPENTLPALAAAVELGCEQLEFDVRCTSDLQLVLLHDPSVDRTTDGSGNVWELTYAELSALDASAAHPYTGPTRIPTLEEALSATPASVELNVHCNPGPNDCGDLVRGVCAALKLHGRLQSSFITGNEDVMEAALGCDPAIRRCMGSRPAAVYDHYGCYAIQPRNALTDTALCESAHAARRLVWPFLANEEAEMSRLVDAGVDGILTDVPERLIALLQERYAGVSQA
jgi:glycerophosphoryl diester phosphodiesterase